MNTGYRYENQESSQKPTQEVTELQKRLALGGYQTVPGLREATQFITSRGGQEKKLLGVIFGKETSFNNGSETLRGEEISFLVDPDNHGQGVAKDLCSRYIGSARERGVGMLFALVVPGSSAERILLGFGFTLAEVMHRPDSNHRHYYTLKLSQ